MKKLSYKFAMDKLPFAVFISDSGCIVKYFNDAFIKTFEPKNTGGLIGSVINCGENDVKCGEGEKCKLCGIRKAFTEAITIGSPTYAKKIKKLIKTDEGLKNLYFYLTVKPLEDGNYMAVIEDSCEADIFKQLSLAKSFQKKLLPEQGDGYSYIYRPSGEVGGDLLGVYERDDGTYAFVADVSGKGIGAAMFSSFIKSELENNYGLPAAVLSNIDMRFKALKTDESEYITVLAAVIDRNKKIMTYSAAGHSVPMLIKTKQKVKELGVNSLPVCNWHDSIERVNYVEPFESGDIAVMLTDGVIYSRGEKGERFGLDRVKEILNGSSNAADFTERLKQEMLKIIDEFDDDMTAAAFDL